MESACNAPRSAAPDNPTAQNKRASLETKADPALLRPLRHPPQEIVDAFGADVALHKVSLCEVSSRFSDFTPLRDVTVGGVLWFLSDHAEEANKDSHGLIYADLHNRRRDITAQSVCAIARDVDGCLPFSDEVERAERAGFVGTTYTSHSHGKTRDEFGCEPAYKWRGTPGSLPFTDEQAAAYLKSQGKGYLTNVCVLNAGHPVHVEGKGHVFQVEHDPVPKLRSIDFFDEAVPLAEVGQDGWRAIYHTLATDDYGGPIYDTACANPARIHYMPAHRPGAPFDREIYGERLRPWRETWERIKPDVVVRREKARPASAAALNEAPADLKEIAHYLGFISPSIGRKQWLSILCAMNRETKGSPEGRALAHAWSAGDPAKYDSEDLDRVWDWCDPDCGATMGTIIYHAKQADNYKRFPRGSYTFSFASLKS